MLYYLEDKTVQELIKAFDENTEKMKEAKLKIETCSLKNTEELIRNSDIYSRAEINAAILTDKLKQAIYDRILPVVIEVVNKYAGKRIGEKTYAKLKDELKARTDCGIYYEESYDKKDIHFTAIPLSDKGYNDWRFPDIKFSYYAPKGEYAILGNVLSPMNREGFIFRGNGVGDHTIDDILTARENIKNAASLLNEAISYYNGMKPSKYKYVDNVYISF